MTNTTHIHLEYFCSAKVYPQQTVLINWNEIHGTPITPLTRARSLG